MRGDGRSGQDPKKKSDHGSSNHENYSNRELHMKIRDLRILFSDPSNLLEIGLKIKSALI